MENYSIKGEEIDIADIRNPQVRQILSKAKRDGVRIDGIPKKHMISFGWGDFRKR